VNQAEWAYWVLDDAGLPQSSTNIANIMRWMAAEEPPDHWWNTNDPLNYGHPTSAPSGALVSLAVAAGLVATALSWATYAGIRAALAASATAPAFSAAVVASPWSGDHYGGTPAHLAQIPVPALFTSPVTKPLPEGLDIMAVTIATGIVAVDGVSGGHKFLFTAPVAQRSTAADWSIMDLSDVATLQHVAGAENFTS